MTSRAAYRIPRPLPALPELGLWGGILFALCALLISSGHRFTLPAPPVQVPQIHHYRGCVLREFPLIVISLDAQGRAYLDTESDSLLQMALIRQVAQQRQVALSAAQLRALSQLPFISHRIEQLPA